MRAMALSLSRSARRRVAGIVGALFFLCQTAAIAQACLAMAPQPDAAAIQQPCHSVGNPGGSPADSAQAGCQFDSPVSAGFDVFATDDLPVVTARLDATLHTASAISFEPPLLQVEPPPLRILNCSLRN